ncbi:MAG: EAL domain-containing protein [Lachnospiraceae bacterium]|nr:EAL domain-containing protein [Lachnospiraceae bacterium]
MTEETTSFNFSPDVKLGEGFCKTANIYVRYYMIESDGSFKRIVLTEDWQSERESTYIEEKFRYGEDSVFLDKFLDGTPENIIKQDCDAGFFKYGVSFRNKDGKLTGVCVFLAVDESNNSSPDFVMKTTEDKLIEALRFFNILMDRAARNLYETKKMQGTLVDVINEGDRNSELLREKSAIAEILKAMEQDDEFTEIASNVLSVAVQELKLSYGELLGLTDDRQKVSVLSKYVLSGNNDADTNDTNDMDGESKDELPFFNGKPFTISSDTDLPKRFKAFFEKNVIRAGVFLPLKIHDEADMYILFVSNHDRRFNQTEIRFMIDVQRVLQSILTRRITTNSLTSSYVTLKAILENAGCGMEVIDPAKGEILYANDTLKKMTEYVNDREQLQLLLMSEDNNEDMRPKFHATGAEKWFDISFKKIKWVDGRSARLCTLYDITLLREYQLKIEHQANTDYLTGLRNRKRCELDISADIRKASRTGKTGAFVILGLDNFRNINDSLGHEFGDKLLKVVAEALQKLVRMDGTIYRIGGDEFVITVDFGRGRELDAFIHNIKKRFSSPWKVEAGECFCTTSIGVTFFPMEGDTSTSIMGRADMALRTAKKEGKNKIAYYDQKQFRSSERLMAMENALHRAVSEGCAEFEVYYQPLVDVSKKQHECCGAEALVRWNCKELGMVMPTEFIPIAEQLGLILPIGEHVLKEACSTCKHWNDFGHPEYKINVNLSVSQLLQDNIVLTVKEALDDSGLEPNNLTLEVTESLAIYDLSNMTELLTKLRDLGVRVALDDFGTGYSSLSYLRFLPLDVIKIDKCFVDDLGEDQFSDAFIKTVSRLADSMKANVVVEGVERIEQANALANMNIDMIQGYLYDKPLPRDMFENKYVE